MSRLISRRDYGFKEDPFEGFVYLKGDMPILQLHQYSEYWTLFWRGSAQAGQLVRSLVAATSEIEQIFNVPLGALSRGTVEYSQGNCFVEAPLLIREGGEVEIEQLVLANAALIDRLAPIDFVRLDIKADVPVVLWADLIDDADSEVGFSSTLMPHSIFELIQETCVASLPERELSQLEDEILERTGRLAAV